MASFLKWLIFFCLLVVGSIFAMGYGVWTKIYSSDPTYLSVGVAGFFLLSTFFSGRAISMGDRGLKDDAIKFNDFAQATCMGLGMLGSLIGFTIILSGFTNLDTSNAAAIQAFVTNIGAGLSTAIYTTISGLGAAILIAPQSHLLQKKDDNINV